MNAVATPYSEADHVIAGCSIFEQQPGHFADEAPHLHPHSQPFAVAETQRLRSLFKLDGPKSDQHATAFIADPHAAVTLIQSHWRRHAAQKQFAAIKQAVVTIQVSRSVLALHI